MKKVLLIDVDAMADKQRKRKRKRYPNIALMKISAWHKQKGDQVSWNEQNPDIVYASVIFTENKDTLYFLQENYPNAEIHIGGSGYSMDELPKEIDQMFPDYSLYKLNYSVGFSTRGCPNNCEYCIVRKKEGKIRPYMKIEQFHDTNHKKVVLFDNNIFAIKKWFKENMKYVQEHELTVDFNQGMDIRLLDEDIIEILKQIKFQELRFAWDIMAISEIVKMKLNIIAKNFKDLKHKCSFYVLVDFNTTMVEDLYRVQYLRALDIPCYIMPYQQIHANQPEPKKQKHIKSLERYCNRRDKYFKYPDYWSYLKSEYKLKYYLKILSEYNKLEGSV